MRFRLLSFTTYSHAKSVRQEVKLRDLLVKRRKIRPVGCHLWVQVGRARPPGRVLPLPVKSACPNLNLIQRTKSKSYGAEVPK